LFSLPLLLLRTVLVLVRTKFFIVLERSNESKSWNNQKGARAVGWDMGKSLFSFFLRCDDTFSDLYVDLCRKLLRFLHWNTEFESRIHLQVGLHLFSRLVRKAT
jgi:hypothetical protein